MADRGYIRSLINGISDETTKRNLTLAFDEVLQNFALGPVEDMKRAVNGQTYFFQGTTSSVANTEFTIRHGQGQAPQWIRGIAPVDSSGVTLPTLRVTRPADVQRLYLSSPSTGVTIFVEVGF